MTGTVLWAQVATPPEMTQTGAESNKKMPCEAVEIIQREKLTDMVGVPTMSHELTLEAERRGVTLDTLQGMGTGGAKRPEAHVEKINQVFPKAFWIRGAKRSRCTVPATVPPLIPIFWATASL